MSFGQKNKATYQGGASFTPLKRLHQEKKPLQILADRLLRISAFQVFRILKGISSFYKEIKEGLFSWNVFIVLFGGIVLLGALSRNIGFGTDAPDVIQAGSHKAIDTLNGKAFTYLWEDYLFTTFWEEGRYGDKIQNAITYSKYRGETDKRVGTVRIGNERICAAVPQGKKYIIYTNRPPTSALNMSSSVVYGGNIPEEVLNETPSTWWIIKKVTDFHHFFSKEYRRTSWEEVSTVPWTKGITHALVVETEPPKKDGEDLRSLYLGGFVCFEEFK
jgi:hypothetical protein